MKINLGRSSAKRQDSVRNPTPKSSTTEGAEGTEENQTRFCAAQNNPGIPGFLADLLESTSLVSRNVSRNLILSPESIVLPRRIHNSLRSHLLIRCAHLVLKSKAGARDSQASC